MICAIIKIEIYLVESPNPSPNPLHEPGPNKNEKLIANFQ